MRAVLIAALRVVRPARSRFAGQVSGIGYAYRAPRGSHPLTGRRVPDVRLAGGGRLHEALRGGRFVLISPAGTGAGDHAGRVVPVQWASGRRTAVLVRPDGYAAWAAESPAPATLAAAVASHAGSPGEAPAAPLAR